MSGNKKRLLSGLQPSGELTIGNYCGGINQFLQYQEQYDSFLFVPDMHAITVPQNDPIKVKERIRRFANLYLACGLNPDRCTFFIQSEVPAHNQLAWILECHTYMGELSRMTQFKDKSSKYNNIGCGLFTYPVLMAADIILYDANVVPVGADQKQHVELARDIVKRMNGKYGSSCPGGQLFVEPTPLIAKVGARIKDLQDPLKKMSKSAENPMGSIYLLDDDATIKKKINRAVTDNDGKIWFDEEAKPGISNLITLYAALSKTPIEDVINRFNGMERYGDLKKEVIDVVQSVLQPVRDEYYRLEKSDYVDKVLDRGRDRAKEIASKKYELISSIVGFGR
ncbi:MAG: tryptophan--tRNA ligase [Bacteroidales bacterium]|jgi:tryptophanyl-tRNA synthetase|nr:tryptophan--tRNA ligase [Bacteroidales bacterium]